MAENEVKFIIMKNLMVIFFILFYINTLAQEGKKVDSLNIMFKAKLLTTSEYGIFDKETILNDIQNQKAVFLNTVYENFLFLKIDFSQPYRASDNTIETLIRNCSYYLAFSKIDNRFYKLGGFNLIQVDDFFKDLIQREELVFKQSSNNILVEHFNISCLYDYYKMNDKKRKKKGFECVKNCNDDTALGLKLN